MELEKWKEMTRRAIFNTAPYFETKEKQVLFDFLETVTEDDLVTDPLIKRTDNPMEVNDGTRD
jgi:hypothetical protein